MKKKLILCLAIFTMVLTSNIAMNNGSSNSISSLATLLQTASAQSENQDPCPGGSCSFTMYKADGKTVDWSCDACCPEGKYAMCSVHGCGCQ